MLSRFITLLDAFAVIGLIAAVVSIGGAYYHIDDAIISTALLDLYFIGYKGTVLTIGIGRLSELAAISFMNINTPLSDDELENGQAQKAQNVVDVVFSSKRAA